MEQQVPTVFISVEKTIRGRKVKATASIPQSGQGMLTNIKWAHRVIGIYLAYEEEDWAEEEGDLDFWLHPSLRLFAESDIYEAIPLEVACAIPFPIQKEFNNCDTTGKTLEEVGKEDPELLNWLAWSTEDYEGMKVAVCAARKLVTLVDDDQPDYTPQF